jgi:hypothetical protein
MTAFPEITVNKRGGPDSMRKRLSYAWLNEHRAHVTAEEKHEAQARMTGCRSQQTIAL